MKKEAHEDLKDNATELKQICSYYAQKYRYPAANYERGLEAYAAHLFVQEEGFDALLDGASTKEADLAEYICRSNDLQIDCILEDELNRRILLVQAAWRAKNLEEDKVAAFFDIPDRILRQEYRGTGGDQVQDLLAGFSDKVADGWEVQLRFVTNLGIGTRDRLLRLVDAKNEAYLDAERAIVCELYGQSELAKREEEFKSAIGGGLVGEVSLFLQADKFILLHEPFRTVVGVIKANELVDLYNKKGVGLALFNLNVRLPLTSKRVNPAIFDTAASDSEGANFLYYNNGVSAVCSSFALDGTELRANRLQIINGAQTVSALVKARRKSDLSKVYVLFRLTETDESYGGAFTDNIIRYNNTQNPVKAADFFSNDPIQVWLRDNFARVSGKGAVPNMYYVYKSGHKPKGATGRGLKIEQMAGVRHAFIYGPVVSYREPSTFFDRQGRYHQAFGVDGRPTAFWPDEELFRAGAALAIQERVQSLAKRLKSDVQTKGSDEAKYLYRLARYVTALVGAGLEAKKAGSFHDYATLVASTVTFNSHVDPVIERARTVLRHEYKSRRATSVQPEYNLARDDETWIRLRDTVREEVLADVVLHVGQ